MKKKPAKAKDAPVSDGTSRGRGRGSLEGRGRGRGGAERVGRAGRGGRAVSQANGTKTTEKAAKTTDEAFGDTAVPAPAASATKSTNGDADALAEFANEPGKDQLDSLATNEPKPAPAAAPSGKPGGWAGLFAKPNPPPAPVAPKKAPTPNTVPTPAAAVPVAAPEEPAPVPAVEEPIAAPVPPTIEPIQVEDAPSELPSAPQSEAATDSAIPPSHDQLTERNLDKLPDVSHPPQSVTVVSTTASTQDPMNPAVPTAPLIRPGMSGYAATALKATSSTGRTPSYSRKLMEQQEAVVMPGNHAVDRTAVQFGTMGLNGDDVDADEDREEPETRTQLPDDSPAAPRASLPPAVPEAKPQIETPAEEAPVPRQAPGLPPAPQSAQQPSPPQQASYPDQYRYGQGQKAYDPFTQQPQAQTTGTGEPFSNQVPGQSQGLPASGQEYSHYYGGNRDAYQGYYGAGYGQAHEGQRSGSAFGTSAQESQAQYATARPQQGFSQSDAQNSGNNTPNPTAASQQSQPSQHVPNQGSYGGHPYNYPNAYGQQYPQYSGSYMGNMSHRYGANRPMFDDVRRDNDYYSNQYSYGHNQQYGGNYNAKMYSQPQSGYSHDYSSSPANAGFGGREGYGRAGSTQPPESQQSNSAGSNAFAGSMADPFGRTSSAGFGQGQSHASHQGSEEQSKASGPSPSLQGNRPGSALNNMSGQQGGLPHPQSQQHSTQGFGGYPQYAGFGNQTHQNSGYNNYGSNAAFGYGGGYGGRGWAGYGGGQH